MNILLFNSKDHRVEFAGERNEDFGREGGKVECLNISNLGTKRAASTSDQARNGRCAKEEGRRKRGLEAIVYRGTDGLGGGERLVCRQASVFEGTKACL